MTPDGLKMVSRYDYVPPPQWRWMRTTDNIALNCIYQQLTFTVDCPTCPIHSSSGILATHRPVGYSVKGHSTYVWDANIGNRNDVCNITVILSSTGDLSSIEQPSAQHHEGNSAARPGSSAGLPPR